MKKQEKEKQGRVRVLSLRSGKSVYRRFCLGIGFIGVLGFIGLFGGSVLRAQSGSLLLDGRMSMEGIRLRWALRDVDRGLAEMLSGYVVEVYGVDGGILKKEGRWEVFCADSLEWKRRMQDSEPGWALVSEALYGESLADGDRYSWILMAAQRDFGVARASGLAWEFRECDRRRSYFFKVYARCSMGLESDTAYWWWQGGSVTEMPGLAGLRGEVSERFITLSWLREEADRYYGSYEIGRSDAGREYEILGRQYFLSDSLQERYLFRDSVRDYLGEVRYRVRGYDIFDCAGPWSEVRVLVSPMDPGGRLTGSLDGGVREGVSVGGDTLAPGAPRCLGVHRDSSGRVVLLWHRNVEEDVVGYRIYRQMGGLDTLLACDSLWADTSYVDQRSLRNRQKTVYFLQAEDSRGNRSDFSVCGLVPGGREKSSDASKVGVVEKGDKERDRVPRIAVEVDRERRRIGVYWRSIPAQAEVLLYRKEGEGPWILWRRLAASEARYEDGDIRMSHRYTYRLRVVFPDGSFSSWSAEASGDY